MKEIKYRGETVFSIGDWQDGERYEEYTVTVAKQKHDNTNRHIYLEDRKYESNKELLLAVREATFIGHVLCLDDRDVLVHCAAGMSRSVLIASIMLYAHDQRKVPSKFESVEEAYQSILEQYPQADVLEELKNSLFSVINQAEIFQVKQFDNTLHSLAEAIGLKIRGEHDE